MAIGTAAAIAGIASSAVGAGMSFAQANSQKKAMKAADAKAAQYMADARKRLEVNYMDELAINKEPYQREREAMLSAGAQAMQASVEGSERGAAANTGRILAAQQEAQGDIRDQMNRDLFNLEAASAEEDSRLRDAQAQLDMGEAAGAQQASAEAAAARQAALSQGIQGAVNTVQGVIAMPSLYGKNKMAIDQTNNRNLTSQLGIEKMPVGGNIQSIAPQSSNQLALPQMGGMLSPIPNQSFSNIQRTPLQSGINFFQYQ